MHTLVIIGSICNSAGIGVHAKDCIGCCVSMCMCIRIVCSIGMSASIGIRDSTGVLARRPARGQARAAEERQAKKPPHLGVVN